MIKNLWEKVSSIGVYPSISDGELVKVRVPNQINFISIVAILIIFISFAFLETTTSDLKNLSIKIWP